MTIKHNVAEHRACLHWNRFMSGLKVEPISSFPSHLFLVDGHGLLEGLGCAVPGPLLGVALGGPTPLVRTETTVRISFSCVLAPFAPMPSTSMGVVSL